MKGKPSYASRLAGRDGADLNNDASSDDVTLNFNGRPRSASVVSASGSRNSNIFDELDKERREQGKGQVELGFGASNDRENSNPTADIPFANRDSAAADAPEETEKSEKVSQKPSKFLVDASSLGSPPPPPFMFAFKAPAIPPAHAPQVSSRVLQQTETLALPGGAKFTESKLKMPSTPTTRNMMNRNMEQQGTIEHARSRSSSRSTSQSPSPAQNQATSKRTASQSPKGHRSGSKNRRGGKGKGRGGT